MVCPNVLGGCQGTTGPASRRTGDGRPYGSRFPVTTIRDQVALEVALADALGIDRWYAVVGGSMGGMRVLEWAVGHRDRVARAVVISVGAQATAEEIALCHVQIRAIRADPKWRGGDYYDAEPGDGPHEGLSIARGIGHISYRTELELAGALRARPPTGRGAVRRRSLRGGVVPRLPRREAGAALRRQHLPRAVGGDEPPRRRPRPRRASPPRWRPSPPTSTIAGMSSDWLYPVRLQQELGELIPTSSTVEIVQTISGHDGFLVESERRRPHHPRARLDADTRSPDRGVRRRRSRPR